MKNNFWAYLKTKQFRITLLLAIGSVFAFVLLVFFGLSFYTRHGEGIPVPKLKGLTIEGALIIMKGEGFQYKIDSVYVLDKPPGMVVEQDPDPGTNVKENRTIYLTIVTQLAPNIELPDLEPYTYREAVATITNYGLKVGDTSYRSDIARDRVLEVRFAGQPIKAGTKLPKGSKIDLVLGNGAGAGDVQIPDLTNQDLDAAKFVIKNNGLALGTVTYQGTITDSTSVIVVAQSPMKDSLSKVRTGTRINLTVAQGKKPDASN